MRERKKAKLEQVKSIKGGGQTFFRAFSNFELGPLEVAPCMAGTFAQNMGARIAISPKWS